MSFHLIKPPKIDLGSEGKSILDTEHDDYLRYVQSRYALSQTLTYVTNILRLKDIIGELIPDKFKTMNLEDEDGWTGLGRNYDFQTSTLIDIFYYLRCLSLTDEEKRSMGFVEYTLIHELHYGIVDMLELM